VRLLRRRKVALVVADTGGRWPEVEDVTADFVYVRLHGSQTLYQSAYTDAELDRWAACVEAWRAGGQPADARLISARMALYGNNVGAMSTPPSESDPVHRAEQRLWAGSRAVLESGGLRLGGFPAWIAWLLVHIYYLNGFRNRILVLIQWAWSYFTFARGARLIVEKRWRSYGDDAER